ncbi:DUF6282 family protein [Vibrio apostichopi]|uniref:DUF6282 family protein n=1 Tax=Vibrio apostichopi TaxID=3035453 RepID=UPI00257322F9|nr:DUF6282 family protein [Vibrio sp. FE10]
MSEFEQYWESRLRFVDVHYHASPDSFERRYHAVEAGRLYARYGGGCVLKNHLGSVTALASICQQMELPVFGSIVLNEIAGGICTQPIKQALCQYQFPHQGRLLVHLPTVVTSSHRSVMSRKMANNSVENFAQVPLRIVGNDGKLLPALQSLLHFSQEQDIVISTGHASREEIYSLLEQVDKMGGGCRVMLNQPANPITGMVAEELISLGHHDWLYIEQTALTVLLGYQSFEDFSVVLSSVPNLLYSSDLGQSCQIDIPEWLKQSKMWFEKIGLSKSRQKDICLHTPLTMLAP